VEETLQYLAERHALVLVTKGDVQEQSGKIERSGVKKYFRSVEVVAEKDSAIYQSIVRKHVLQSDRTWMIGNSPKSDINPALRAGINAVFIPHDDTWILEHEDLERSEPIGQLLVLKTFSELQSHF
jgi:putative hydrolase of the HAD superfamily